MNAPPLTPHDANLRVPRALSTLCLRLLSRTPGERGSAQALCEEVEALLTGADSGWEVPLHDLDLMRSRARGAPPGMEAERWTPAADGPVTPDAGRWASRVEALAPPSLPAPPEGAGARVLKGREGRSPARSQRWLLAAVLAGLGACLTVALARVHGEAPEARPVHPAVRMTVGREVARSALGLEPAGAAPPPLAVSTSAAAAPAASLQDSDMPVKTTPPTDNSSTPAPSGGWGPMGRALATAAACAGMACSSGPQVRPPPKPEACPPGAVEAMRALGIDVDYEQHGSATFATPEQDNHVLTVRDGPVQIRVGIGLGRLNNGKASGRLFVSDRVYGYFDQGTTRDGQSSPVGLIMRGPETRDRGMPREPGDSSPGSARIDSEVALEAVERFE